MYETYLNLKSAIIVIAATVITLLFDSEKQFQNFTLV